MTINSSILPASGLSGDYDIANVNISLADTEYSFSLPEETKAFRMQVRGDGDLQIRKTSGNSAYFRLFQGDAYEAANLKGTTAPTFYVQSNKPSQIIEILFWT